MKFIDSQIFTNLCIGQDSVEDMVRSAKDLGYSGVVVNCNYNANSDIRGFLDKLNAIKVDDMEIVAGVTIDAKDVIELKGLISKVREQVELVIVRGGRYAVNRGACEDSRVDILMNPHAGRIDNGLDEACLGLAKKNNVAIGISFRPILKTYRRQRAQMLQNVATNLKLCRELGVKIIGCSGAQNKWELRDARQMIAVADSFGLDLGKGFSALTTTPIEILQKNKKILAGEQVRGAEMVIGGNENV